MNLDEYIEILKQRVGKMRERIENKDIHGLSTLDVMRPFSDLYHAEICKLGGMVEQANIEYKEEEIEDFKQWVEKGIEEFPENQ